MVEEIYEEGSASLSERLHSKYPLCNMFKLFMCAVCQVECSRAISKEELRQAIRSTGGHFATFESRRGLRSADVNQDGYIGEYELDNLVEFAQKYLEVKIVHF